MTDFIGLFILFAGFIIGLGAVTIIDIHGFLGRTSSYWTEATTRTHKVTKPLIWLGMLMITCGGFLFYKEYGLQLITIVHIISLFIMIINGVFLSFSVSPYLIEREKMGKEKELLPKTWQNKITISFLISFVLWWGNLLLLVWVITSNLK